MVIERVCIPFYIGQSGEHMDANFGVDRFNFIYNHVIENRHDYNQQRQSTSCFLLKKECVTTETV
ncbi:hypothetical protein NFHkm12_05460 [Latilactobacillus curvatus]|nr:hypothetical protein NFHkm12_05460 [Latilactobacillus curvatus]